MLVAKRRYYGIYSKHSLTIKLVNYYIRMGVYTNNSQIVYCEQLTKETYIFLIPLIFIWVRLNHIS